MAITWSPILTTLEKVIKPSDTLFTISAVSDDILVTSSIHTVIIQDFPDTSIINSTDTEVNITGNSIDSFSYSAGITYLENGRTKKTTLYPDDLLKGDDITAYPADTRTTENVSITVKAQFFDVSLEIVEEETVIFNLTIYNSWDGHKASMNEIMERLY